MTVDLTEHVLIQISPHILLAFLRRNRETCSHSMSQLPFLLLSHDYVTELMRHLLSGNGMGMPTPSHTVGAVTYYN